MFVSMPPDGICYSTAGTRLGFRGASKGFARLIPLSEKEDRKEELFFFQGVDVPADILPYLPDMSLGSDFIKEGHWHWYEIEWGIFIVHIDGSKKTKNDVLNVVHFKGEDTPRVFLDRRRDLKDEGLLTSRDLDKISSILAKENIVLS